MSWTNPITHSQSGLIELGIACKTSCTSISASPAVTRAILRPEGKDQPSWKASRQRHRKERSSHECIRSASVLHLWHGIAAEGNPANWVLLAFVFNLFSLTATVATRGFTTLCARKGASIRGWKVVGFLVPAATMTQCMGQWQLELFYKRKQDLTDKILPFLRENSLHRLNITNKVCWKRA